MESNHVINSTVEVDTTEKEFRDEINNSIKILEKIGFDVNEGNLIIKNSIKGQRLKNYLSIINEKLETKEGMSELEIIHPDDITKMREMETSLNSMLKKVEKADMVELGLMLKPVKDSINSLEKMENLSFKEESNRLMSYIESSLIQCKICLIDAENQKKHLESKDETVKAQTRKAIEDLKSRRAKHKSNADKYTDELRAFYSSTFDLKYITEAKKRRYTTDLQKNLDKLDSETIEFYKAFTRIFDLTPQTYKEFMDEEKTTDGHFKLDSEKQKYILDGLDMDDMKDLIKFVYKINSSFLLRSFFTNLMVAKEKK